MFWSSGASHTEGPLPVEPQPGNQEGWTMHAAKSGLRITALTFSVLFYLGMHHVNPSRWPRVYIILWIVVLLLVLWLCIIAAADMLYTRRITRETLQKSRRSR